MSVAEMKLAVISKVTGVDSELLLKEVLQILKANDSKSASGNLSKNYDTIKEQYGDVLQKLAK